MTAKKLAKYELQEKLGEGGFGTVYRVVDTTLGVERALKELHPQLAAAPGFRERFLREARLGAQLEHFAITPVYEIGEADGGFYLVMKYMENGSLKDLLFAEGALPWGKTLAIIRQVAAGLDHAHAAGVVHRDVKPGNILFDEAGAARLGDFGYARTAAGSPSLTATGALVGTPHYMAPELWLGEKKAGPPTAAADIYSLACMVYEMLTGAALFDGETPPEVMTQHVMGDFDFPAEWPAGVPEDIEGVLLKALAKEPGERYASCGDFVDAVATVGAQGDRLTITLAPGVNLELLRIPAGEFLMGSTDADKDADDNEKPQHKVYLDEYWMGRYPVTVAQFRAFVEASGFQPVIDDCLEGQDDDHPVVWVNWHDSRAFCEWVTGRVRAQGLAPQRIRLPSEAEWEKAARGTDGRDYPWGKEKPGLILCNFGDNEGGTTPVGRYSPRGDSPYGCADMAGNAWEWTSSLHKDYPYRAQDGREDPATSGHRVLRGGGFDDSAWLARCASRDNDYPDVLPGFSGFRVCARRVERSGTQHPAAQRRGSS
jgi:formylglycine-generating enzyme required for sulfatase activity